jgi:DNA-binding transcriptional MerR regulator
MSTLEDRRYSITEVSKRFDLQPHLLRQWEKQIPELNPKRDKANRRYYQNSDIELLQRIKQLVHGEKMTLQGAKKRIAQEHKNEAAPLNTVETLEIIDQIEQHARNIISKLDSYENEKA